MAPELIEEDLFSPAADFWSLGCLVYLMLTGKEPFDHKDKQDVIYSIVMNDLDLDEVDCSDEARDLMDKLLQSIVEMRLGSGAKGSQQHISELQNHPWFVLEDGKKIDFETFHS